MKNFAEISPGDLGPDFAKSGFKPKDYSDFEPPKENVSEVFPLEEPQNEPAKPTEQPENKKVETENLPEGIISTLELAKSLTPENIDSIYKWYAEAMGRRDREPLARENFEYHFFEGGSWEPTYATGNVEKGFIFGFYKHGIFIPTHFAPKTMRGGYTLFKELAENKELPVATAVTDDLAKTLMKIKGWHQLKVSLLAYFNSDLKKKVVVYNSADGVRLKIIGLLKEFWEETKKLKKQQE